MIKQERAIQLQAEKEKLIDEAKADGLPSGDNNARLNWLYQKATEARADLTEIRQKFNLSHKAPFKLLLIKIDNAIKSEKELMEIVEEAKQKPARGIAALRQTHTYAVLSLSEAAFKEIAGKLEEAGYAHAFDGEGKERVIDMHGIAVQSE